MADLILWPPELGGVLSGFGAEPNKNVKHTAMGSGNAKSAQIDDVEFYTITGSLIMTRAQLITFRAFLRDGIDFGATPFRMTDPVTLEEKVFKLREYGTQQQVTPKHFQFPVTFEEVP